MAYPEVADVLVGGGEGQPIPDVPVREAGGVEVDAIHAQLFGERYPRREMLRAVGVPIDETCVIAQKGIAGVQVESLFAGHQEECRADVGHQLLGGAGAPGVISRGLNTARCASAAVKSDYVVALPAVDADGDVSERFQCCFRVNAECGELFLCIIKACGNGCVIHESSAFPLILLGLLT